MRALTSASFAVASVALGLVYGVAGYGPAALVFGVFGVATAIAGGRVPDLGRATLAAHRRGGAIREAFAVQPALPRILVAIGLVYSGVLAGFTFLPLRIVELGGGAPEVAIASAVSAAVEIGAMVAAGRLVPRIGLRVLFGASALLYAVSLALWGVLPSPEAIIVSRPVSGVGYAGLWIAGVMTIQRLLPAHLQGSGQALFTITATGVAGVLANIGGGLVYGGPGAGTLFAIAAGLAVAGAVVGWTALPDRGAPSGARPEPESVPGA
ncbi:MAG: hypothetical protein A2V85_06775 [Chloroflexi bacterium RBG_16_72_14]|nr:MAG: hypothetical protein A2V85_06775 [Chloroflexi bacterium RBG_16_72_14]